LLAFRVFFEIGRENGSPFGRMIAMLHVKRAPEVIEAFIEMCSSSSKPNSYQNCKIYKILKNLLLEMGDVESNDGNGKHTLVPQMKQADSSERPLKHTAGKAICVCAAH